jgi:antitoxin CcdA
MRMINVHQVWGLAMTDFAFAKDGPKRAVNLSINNDLLKLGKDLDINLSGIAEAALARAVKERLGQRWLEENEGAIQAYNLRVAEQGVFSDGLRTF